MRKCFDLEMLTVSILDRYIEIKIIPHPLSFGSPMKTPVV